jgi:exonuclease III
MMMSSWNIRGLGERVKKQKLHHHIVIQRVDLMAVQETKIEVIGHKLCSQLCGGDMVRWRYAPALGRSGGILTLWDGAKGNCVSSFQRQGYLGVCLEWGAKKSLCLIVNVYAPRNLHSKKALWVDLLNKGEFGAEGGALSLLIVRRILGSLIFSLIILGWLNFLS